MKKQRGCSMRGGLVKIGGDCAAKPLMGGNLPKPLVGGDEVPKPVMGGDALKPIVGGDASTHAERVYGAPGQQAAAPGNGNVIATRGMAGGYRHRRSGRSKRGGASQKRGGTAVVDLAVPAALLYGQQKYLRRSRKNKFSKSRFTRRH